MKRTPARLLVSATRVGGCAVFAAGVVLSGCSTPYQRPPAAIAAAWPTTSTQTGKQSLTAPSAESPSSEAPSPRELHWRDFFQDPRLRALIAQALEHNRDLRLALGRIEESRLALGLAQAERVPNLGLNTVNAKEAVSESIAGGADGVNAQRFDFKLQMVSYELDFWGRLSSLSEAAKARMAGTQAASRVVRISLISEVANAYYLQLDLQERIGLLREVIATRERTRDMTIQAFEAGAVSKFEVLQSESILETSRGELAMLGSQLAATRNTLDFLTGHAPSELPPGYSLASQRPSAPLAVDLPSNVLLKRPDVMAAEQRLIEAHANVDAARAMFFPRILLTASAGFASLALNQLFTSQGSGNWSYLGNISLPLFDGGRTAASFDIAKLREVQAVSDYERIVQTSFREVADLLAAREGLARQVRAVSASRVILQQRAQVAEIRYRGGSASYIEVLDALREELATAQQLALLRRSELVNAAQLYKALGGGEDATDR
jgi:outer membrane protein, multidrug efflux system